MQNNSWSSYYQGQAPPQASTSGSFDYSQQKPHNASGPVDQSTVVGQQHAGSIPPQQLPHIYTGDMSMSMSGSSSMRNNASLSISSSVSSSNSGHVSPTSMRTSMSSSTTSFTPMTPATPLSLSSPVYYKEPAPGDDSWFGSLQDTYLSSAPSNYDYDTQQGPRPNLYRMERMSITSPLPASREAPWSQHSMSPTTPRRASVNIFSSSPQGRSIGGAVQPAPYTVHSQYPSTHGMSYLSPEPSWSNTTNQSLLPSYSYVPQPQQTLQPYYGQAEQQQSQPLHQSYNMLTDSQPPSASSSQGTYNQSMQGWSGQASVPASSENFNFSGVLLDPEDLHLLGPDPLTTLPPGPEPMYQPSQAGWQTSFSFGGDSTPKAIQQSTMPTIPRQLGSISENQQNFNFDSFHGFTPLSVVGSIPLAERAASAPPVDIVEAAIQATLGEEINRRRGSSVDSPSILPMLLDASTLQLPQSPTRSTRKSFQSSPVYLGRGPVKVVPSALATRRATVGPSPLDLARSPRVHSSPLSQSVSLQQLVPPKSAPLPVTAAPSPMKRMGGRRSAAPMFINFTGKDAKKLLSGVAPSGSSKRKREEEEARQAKQVKFDQNTPN